MYLQPEIMAPILVCFFASGIVKGLTGIGFLTVCISALVFFIDLKLAMALVVASSIVGNLTVMMEAGGIVAAARRFWPMYLVALPGLYLGVQVLVSVDESVLLFGLAIVIVLFSLYSLTGAQLSFFERHAKALYMPIGFLHGLIAGLTGSQVVPTIPFLLSLDISRAVYLQAQNMMLTICAIGTAVIFSQKQLFPQEVAVTSLICVVPTILGVTLGGVLRRGMGSALFRQVTLVALLVTGTSLAWKSSGADVTTAQAWLETLLEVANEKNLYWYSASIFESSAAAALVN